MADPVVAELMDRNFKAWLASQRSKRNRQWTGKFDLLRVFARAGRGSLLEFMETKGSLLWCVQHEALTRIDA